MNKQAEGVNEKDLEMVSFTGLYFGIIGSLWVMLWQLNKVVDYASMLKVSAEIVHWSLIGLVALIVTYLVGYMIYLEKKKKIDSKILLVKYVIGLVFGYINAQILIG